MDYLFLLLWLVILFSPQLFFKKNKTNSTIIGRVKKKDLKQKNKAKKEAENIKKKLFTQKLFFLASEAILVDGKFSEVELNYLKKYFSQKFGEVFAQKALLYLKIRLKKDIDVEGVYTEINSSFTLPDKIQMLHLIVGVTAADSIVYDVEMNFILNFAKKVNINIKTVESILAMHSFSKKEEKTKRKVYTKQNVETSYTILEVSSTCSDEDVKKAYRKLAILHHPDKVHHLGNELMLAAKEKFQKIKDAYEKVKKERGF